MDNQSALFKSLRFLSRPYAIFALLLLLANDQVLRRIWPSWWTGKLGDFAWLFVAPAVLAGVLSLLAPAFLRPRSKWAGGLAYGGTAVFFIALKTLPAFRELALGLFQQALGVKAAAVLDPTDLIALAALGISGLLWFREAPLLPRRAWLACLVAPVFALAALADAAAPNLGIACLQAQDGQITASSSYEKYRSTDGGLTWQMTGSGFLDCPNPAKAGDPVRIGSAGLQLRYQPGAAIELSQDGGLTWQVDYRLHGMSQAENAFYQKTEQGNPMISPGPLDAVGDPKTGNFLLAMGHEGVLVRQADGSWTWAAVGSYRRADYGQVFPFVTVLGGEIVLAVVVGLLTIAVLAMRFRKASIVENILLGLTGLILAVLLILFPPAVTTGYLTALSWILIFAAGLLSLALAIISMIALWRNPNHAVLRTVPFALGGGVLFLVPFVLWYFNGIPVYGYADGFAVILSVICAADGIWRLNRLSAAPAN